MTGQNRILRFDRTPVARLISCAATFASAALVFDYLSHGSKEVEPLTLTGLMRESDAPPPHPADISETRTP